MSTKVAGLEIIKLWASVFLEKDLPDHQASTRRLISLAGSRCGEGVFAIDDPGVVWLKGQIAQAVDTYLIQAGRTDAPAWGAQGRFESFETDEFRPLANQPGAYLAGMYVLQWPSTGDASGVRDDALPGCFSFYDPRVGMNMNAIKRDPYYSYHRHLIPRAGLLVIWPAYVSYFVHPNPSAEPAMRVAFDVHLHAPSQEAR